MSERPRLRLGQVFALMLVGLATLLGLLLYGVDRSARRTIADSADVVRGAASATISYRLEATVRAADQVLDGFERRIRLGVIDPDRPVEVERELFALLADQPNAAGISLTRASSLGFEDTGERRLAEEGRWQIMVFRETADAASPLQTLFVRRGPSGFVAEKRSRASGGALPSGTLAARPEAAPDPTTHPTIAVAAARFQAEDRRGQPLWSDLSYFEGDAHLPERERRVEVSAQRAVEDGHGRFVGVARFGLRTEAVDAILREEAEHAQPFRLFLCDEEGRLVSRTASDDPLREQPDESLRFEPRRLSPELAPALAQPGLRTLTPERPEATARFTQDGRTFLASFRMLPNSQGWRVGTLVAEDELPGLAGLIARRNQLLVAVSLVSLLILAGGLLTLRAIQSGLRQIDRVTAHMQEFDFRPDRMRSPFADVSLVMDRLEQAKTALRALGKYVPIDLVRLLYGQGQEPMLGGHLQDVSMMFTDIKDFTSLSERLTPDELAFVLGRYLEVVTAAIQREGGTIDKYIGDSIMALWNAPTETAGHAKKACAGALGAVAAAEALGRSAEWAGRPPLVTRFGLHRDRVMVGHFGAPDRMSYTALGDGVNLASRLEGLNKAYGTTILVSEAIRQDAADAFEFRLVDAVAVKGKSQGVRVYELLCEKGAAGPRLEMARRYERAFASYQGRDFTAALALLDGPGDDGPSGVLAARCREFLATPPPPEWAGTHVATSK